MTHTYQIKISGLVQGVGFRPFVYRLANSYDLKGTVENRSDGVWIKVTATESILDNFKQDLNAKAPPASEVIKIDVKRIKDESFTDFSIIKSKNLSDQITLVSPDIAVCDNCLHDMETQPNRIDYPFTNCTNCGPRFTIIRDLPYDRSMTTMDVFEMCDSCRKEYEDVRDRRFHAQPVACNDCGPHYTLRLADRKIEDQDEILDKVTGMLEDGKVLSVKGLGGFFLACNALDEQAVSRLRTLKIREGKPFAVLFRDIESVKKYALVNREEEQVITSWRRPIVLLRTLKDLATSVCMGFPSIGAMLPYMPFHYLLFRRTHLEALVLTSGNLADEPILIRNREALSTFLNRCDGVLLYNREIYNRVDDSVSMVVHGKERVIRRSRGYVPAPVKLCHNADGLLAAGAELVNSFAVGRDNQVFLSQHIGDLKNLETYGFYKESIERFIRIFRVKPHTVVCDLHPDYLSTKFALETGLPVIRVQHHHAHIASCMAEHHLDEPVLGVAFDGIGLGDDGNIWGGEFLICDLKDYRRFSNFQYIPMPGGDQATLNPWRMAVSYLIRAFGKEWRNLNLPFLAQIDLKKIELIEQMVEKKINSPLTSSAGRLFDAVAALTGLCNSTTFHAEAPMRLEAAIKGKAGEVYDFVSGDTIQADPMIRQITRDVLAGKDPAFIALKFHNTVNKIIIDTALKMAESTGIQKIVLSGGTFQNRYLIQHLEPSLKEKGFMVYTSGAIPGNDGGIALGQMAIASAKNQD